MAEHLDTHEKQEGIPALAAPPLLTLQHWLTLVRSLPNSKHHPSANSCGEEGCQGDRTSSQQWFLNSRGWKTRELSLWLPGAVTGTIKEYEAGAGGGCLGWFYQVTPSAPDWPLRTRKGVKETCSEASRDMQSSQDAQVCFQQNCLHSLPDSRVLLQKQLWQPRLGLCTPELKAGPWQGKVGLQPEVNQ